MEAVAAAAARQRSIPLVGRILSVRARHTTRGWVATGIVVVRAAPRGDGTGPRPGTGPGAGNDPAFDDEDTPADEDPAGDDGSMVDDDPAEDGDLPDRDG